MSVLALLGPTGSNDNYTVIANQIIDFETSLAKVSGALSLSLSVSLSLSLSVSLLLLYF